MAHMIPSNIKIQIKFKAYEKSMRDVWESYNLVQHYMGLSKDEVKKGNFNGLPSPSLWGNNVKIIKKDDTYGAISHLRDKSNPRRTLINAVAIFENYLSILTTIVFEDFPGKLISHENSKNEDGYQKLLKNIVESIDKNEIVKRIVEEKVRSIFYGKPSSYFRNIKLEFGNHFTSNFKDELEIYEEITARRNIIIHNNGKVDRKYLREIKGSGFKLGQTVPIDSEYLRNAIMLLLGLSAEATGVVLRKVYKSDVRGVVLKIERKFNLNR